MSDDDEQITVPNVFCRCVGRMIPADDCEAGCPAMAQLRSLASAYRPRGPAVEHPPRRDPR